MRNASARTRRRRALCGAALTSLCAAACGERPSQSTDQSVATAASPVNKAGTPPVGKYEVTLEIPAQKDKPASAPPEAALGPWRVWINQERPRQKKNPRWQSFPAKSGGALDLAADGRWRCVIHPVRMFGKADEDMSVAHWTASRSVLCSSDGWTTHVDGKLQVGYLPDGTPTPAKEEVVLFLRDTVEGKPRETTVVLRADEAKRKGAKAAPSGSAAPADSAAPPPSAPTGSAAPEKGP